MCWAGEEVFRQLGRLAPRNLEELGDGLKLCEDILRIDGAEVVCSEEAHLLRVLVCQLPPGERTFKDVL